jgi:preprotein translocase subunit SecG
VFGLLLALIILLGILLVVIILLQAGKGGGLAAVGGGAAGTDTFIGGRQAATLLTRATWVGGAVFMSLALVLAVLSTRARTGPDPVLRGEFQEAPGATPQPVLPGVEPAQPGEGAAPGAAQPGTPAEPVPPPAPAPGQ